MADLKKGKRVRLEVVDNALGGSLFDLIKNAVESNNFPWFFIENSAYPPGDKELIAPSPLYYSFSHLALKHGEIQSNYHDMIISVASVLKDLFRESDLQNYDIIRLRWGMTTSINKVWKNEPHIDMKEKHKVILFYLNDSDGDTYFYDKDHNIIDSVTPKENRAVLFDGSILHSSSKPVEFAKRIVLNINLKERE